MDCRVDGALFSGLTVELADIPTMVSVRWTASMVAEGLVDEVDSVGDLMWRVQTSLESGFGFSQRVESLY